MNPAPVGTRIRIIREGPHNYLVGGTYVVSAVEPDGSLRATDPRTGLPGDSIPWFVCEAAPLIGWEFLSKLLPPDAVRLLSAFDGIENLSVREDVKEAILAELDDLAHRITIAVREEAAGVEPAEPAPAKGQA